jgi:hypothetical protein
MPCVVGRWVDVLPVTKPLHEYKAMARQNPITHSIELVLTKVLWEALKIMWLGVRR